MPGLLNFIYDHASGQASARAALLQEELKKSQLERADFESSQAFRAQQRANQLAYQSSQNTSMLARSHIDQLEEAKQQALQQTLLETEPAEARGRAQEATARGSLAATTARGVEEDYPANRRATLARTSQEETAADKAQTDEFVNKLGAARIAGSGLAESQDTGKNPEFYMPGAEDASALVGALNIKGDAAKGFMGAQILSGFNAQRQKIQDNRNVLAMKLEDEKQKTYAQFGEGMLRAGQLGGIIGDAEFQNPGVTDAFKSLGEKLTDPMQKLFHETAYRIGASAASKRRSVAATMNPVDLDEAKEITKELPTLQKDITAAKSGLAKVKDTTYFTTSRRTTAESKAQNDLNDAVKALYEKRQRLNELRSGTKSGAGVPTETPKGEDSPAEMSIAEARKLPAGSKYRLKGDPNIYTRGK